MATKRVKTAENSVTPTVSARSKKEKTGAKRAARSASDAHDPSPIGSDARRSLVATEAYYRAERRGFIAGHELEDWVAAERAVDANLTEPP
jgi:hypothetical protein